MINYISYLNLENRYFQLMRNESDEDKIYRRRKLYSHSLMTGDDFTRFRLFFSIKWSMDSCGTNRSWATSEMFQSKIFRTIKQKGEEKNISKD